MRLVALLLAVLAGVSAVASSARLRPRRILGDTSMPKSYLIQISTFWNDFNSPGGTPPDWNFLWCSTLLQGGYAPTPASASADDQVWLVMATFWTIAKLGLNPWASEAVLASDFSPIINQWISDWQSGRTNLTFAQFADQQQLGLSLGSNRYC